MATVARRARVRNTGRRRMGKYEGKYHEMCDFVQRVMLENVAYMNLLRQKEDESQQALLQCRTLFRKLMQRVDLISEEDGHVLDKVAVTLGGVPPSAALKAAEEAASQAHKAKKVAAAAGKSRHKHRTEKKHASTPKAKSQSKSKGKDKSAAAKRLTVPSPPTAAAASAAAAAASAGEEAGPSRDGAIFQAQRGLRRKQGAEKARTAFYTQLRGVLKELGVMVDDAAEAAEAAGGEEAAPQEDDEAAGTTVVTPPRSAGKEQEHAHKQTEQEVREDTGKGGSTQEEGEKRQEEWLSPHDQGAVVNTSSATKAEAEAARGLGPVEISRVTEQEATKKKKKKKKKRHDKERANSSRTAQTTGEGNGLMPNEKTKNRKQRDPKEVLDIEKDTSGAGNVSNGHKDHGAVGGAEDDLHAVSAEQEEEGAGPEAAAAAATKATAGSKKRRPGSEKGQRDSKAAKKVQEDAVHGDDDDDSSGGGAGGGERMKKGKKGKTKEHTTRHTITVRRADDGSVILPIHMTNGNIVALGKVQRGRERFDFEDITYPIGFQAELKLRNKSGNRIKVTFRIEEDGERPLFKAIIHTRQEEHLFTDHSLEDLYRTLLRQMKRQESKHTVRRAGKMLGVGEPSVVAILKTPDHMRTVQEDQPQTPGKAKRRRPPAPTAAAAVAPADKGADKGADRGADRGADMSGTPPRRRRKKDGQKAERRGRRERMGQKERRERKESKMDLTLAREQRRDEVERERGAKGDEDRGEDDGQEGALEALDKDEVQWELDGPGRVQTSDDMTGTEPSFVVSPRSQDIVPHPQRPRPSKRAFSPPTMLPVPQPKPTATQAGNQEDQVAMPSAIYPGVGEQQQQRRRRQRRHRREGTDDRSSSSSARSGANPSKAMYTAGRTASPTSGDAGASTESASLPSRGASPTEGSSSANTSGKHSGSGGLVQPHEPQHGYAGHVFPGHPSTEEHNHYRPQHQHQQQQQPEQEQQAFAPPSQLFSPGGQPAQLAFQPQQQLQLPPPVYPHTPQEAQRAQGGSAQSSMHSPQQQHHHAQQYQHQPQQLPYGNSAHMTVPVLQGYHHMPSLPPGSITPMLQSSGMPFPLGGQVPFGMPSFTQASRIPVSTPFYHQGVGTTPQHHGLYQQPQESSPQQLHAQQGAFAAGDPHPNQVRFGADEGASSDAGAGAGAGAGVGAARGSSSRKKSKHKHRHKAKSRAREQ